MTEIARLFDLKEYGSAAFAEMMNDFSFDGVVRDGDNELAVSAGAGMSVNIETGRAIIQGYWYKNTTVANLVVPANTTGATRGDRIVLRLDLINKTLLLAYKAVVDATPPAVVRTTGIWEITIGILDVPDGVSSILSGYIRNLQNSLEYGGNPFGGRVNPKSYNRLALNVNLSSNISVAQVASTWTTFWGPHNFDLKWDNSMLIIGINGRLYTVQTQMPTRLLIDGVAAAPLGRMFGLGNSNPLVGGGGFHYFKGYLKGTHTITLQTYGTTVDAVACQPATAPNVYGLRIQAAELYGARVN